MVVITLFGLTLRHCSYFYAIAPLSELESARAFFCPSYRRSLFARGDTFGVIRSKWPQTGAWLPVLAGTSLIITINNRYTFSHLLPFQQTLNQVPSRFVLLTTLIKSQSNPIAQSLENQYSTEISNDLRDSYERLFFHQCSPVLCSQMEYYVQVLSPFSDFLTASICHDCGLCP